MHRKYKKRINPISFVKEGKIKVIFKQNTKKKHKKPCILFNPELDSKGALDNGKLSVRLSWTEIQEKKKSKILFVECLEWEWFCEEEKKNWGN